MEEYSFGQKVGPIRTDDREGPLKNAFFASTAGVLRQELITYRMISGKLHRETVVRTYSNDGDYIDSTSTTMLDRGSSV